MEIKLLKLLSGEEVIGAISQTKNGWKITQPGVLDWNNPDYEVPPLAPWFRFTDQEEHLIDNSQLITQPITLDPGLIEEYIGWVENEMVPYEEEEESNTTTH